MCSFDAGVYKPGAVVESLWVTLRSAKNYDVCVYGGRCLQGPAIDLSNLLQI